MSKVSTVPRPPQRFDLQKFEALNEPFTILVRKHKGSTQHDMTPPIPPDEGPDYWNKERVRGLETWIVNEWSGGGHYTFAIADSSVPPQSMEWTSYYPPQEFPEKYPPTLQQATQGQQSQQQPQQQQPQQQVAQAQPQTGAVTQLRANVLPPSTYFMHQQPHQPQQAPAPQPAPAPAPQPQQVAQMNQAFPQPIPTLPPSTESAELRLLREQLQQAREAAAQRDFDRRVAEMKAESDKRFTEMQQLISSMSQQLMQQQQQFIQQQQARPVADTAVEELKAQNRALQEKMEAAERARREDELRNQVKIGQEETRRLVEAMNQRFEAMLRDSGNKGPDPQFMMMMQMMKDIAQAGQSQLDRLQNMMMRPQDILAMAQASSSTAEGAVAGVTRQFEAMFGMQRQLVEQAASLNQGTGGNEVIGLIKDVGEKVGDWAGRYSTGKSREEVERMRSQAEVAKANAEAIKAQQASMAEMARLEAALKSGAVVQMPDGSFRAPPGREQAAIPAAAAPAPANGTNGHAANGKPPWQIKASKPSKKPAIEVVPESVTTGNGLSGPASSNIPSSVPKPYGHGKIKGYTEDEWFGPMLPDVHRLRAAVDLFIKGVNETPPRKPEDSAAPEECAFAINQAASEIMRLQIPIKAVNALLIEGAVADFLDLLLPDAPQLYRDDVVKLLMEGGDDDKDDDEDEDKDEDDNDEKDSQESAAS